MDKRHILLALALSAPVLGGADSCITNDLLLNASFDLWCGDELCGWVVEAGEVIQVPTWHELDSGAELRGEYVALSQYAPAGPDEAACVEFSLLADADLGAELELQLDFLDDGVVDWQSPISAEDWSATSYKVRTPVWFEGIRFRIVKRGDARAVIAQVRALGVDDGLCSGEPVVLHDLPEGVECDTADACGGGYCEQIPYPGSTATLEAQTCAACGDDADCGTGLACGLDWSDLVYGHRDCVESGAKALGEVCVSDAECGSGICEASQCAECGDQDPCADGGACERHLPLDVLAPAQGLLRPYTCTGTVGSRLAGEGCLADEDCASGTCQGTGLVKVCDPDGRPCQSDSDCPLVDFGAECVTVAVADGTCL